MDYLVLKFTPNRVQHQLLTRSSWMDVMSTGWNITPRKTKDVTRAIILYDGCIVREYHVESQSIVNNAIVFEFVDDLESDIVGHQIKYPTSNPASVITPEKLQTLLEDL